MMPRLENWFSIWTLALCEDGYVNAGKSSAPLQCPRHCPIGALNVSRVSTEAFNVSPKSAAGVHEGMALKQTILGLSSNDIVVLAHETSWHQFIIQRSFLMTSSYLLALAATGPCGATSFGNTTIAEFAGLFDTALFSCLDLFCVFFLY